VGRGRGRGRGGGTRPPTASKWTWDSRTCKDRGLGCVQSAGQKRRGGRLHTHARTHTQEHARTHTGRGRAHCIESAAAGGGEEAHGGVANGGAEVDANVTGGFGGRRCVPESVAGVDALGGCVVGICRAFVGIDGDGDEGIDVVAAVLAEGASGSVVADGARAREKVRQFGDCGADARPQEHKFKLGRFYAAPPLPSHSSFAVHGGGGHNG